MNANVRLCRENADAARADTLVVLDFETTGLSPGNGDRAIEIGAILIEHGVVTDHFQALMNPGFPVSGFIESYTGITNDMLAGAPPCDEVMDRFAGFLGDHNVVAHNASFDRRFLDAEFGRIGRAATGEFACSMLISRRLYPDAPNHKLGTLVHHRNIAHDGTFHRALADSEMTTRLWLAMLEDLGNHYDLWDPPLALLRRLSREPARTTPAFLSREADARRHPDGALSPG